MVRTTLSLIASALVLASAPLSALADTPKEESVSVVGAQFTDRVEGSKPVGDAASLASAKTATYWVDVKNAKDATKITLVWKVDVPARTRARVRRWRADLQTHPGYAVGLAAVVGATIAAVVAAFVIGRRPG